MAAIARTPTERRLAAIELMLAESIRMLVEIDRVLSQGRPSTLAPRPSTIDLVAYRNAIRLASTDKGGALKAYLKSGKGIPPRAENRPMTDDRH